MHFLSCFGSVLLDGSNIVSAIIGNVRTSLLRYGTLLTIMLILNNFVSRFGNVGLSLIYLNNNGMGGSFCYYSSRDSIGNYLSNVITVLIGNGRQLLLKISMHPRTRKCIISHQSVKLNGVAM